MGVTEHLPDYPETLKHYQRLLKPGRAVYLDASASRKRYDLSTFFIRRIFPGNGIAPSRENRTPEPCDGTARNGRAAHACRSARMGSTFAARAAGIHAASRQTATITPRLAR